MKSRLFVIILAAASVATSASSKHSFLKHALRAPKAQTLPRDDSLLFPTGLIEETPPREPQPKIDWPEQSAVPVGVQWCLAGSWVILLGSLPFIMPIIDQKPVTKTQIGVGTAMLSVLLGGFYLFTNVILFQSVHFRQIRPLTTVECIYFMSQVITTVGYGDITPAKVRGQVFVGLYVLGALTVIAMLISDITNHVVKMAQAYKERRNAANNADTRDDRVKDFRSLIIPERPSAAPLLTSLACFAVIDICWVIFFSTYPGEGKTVFQALYMSVITLSTVGLGYFTPVTEAGMIFGAFWMLFGTAALVSVIGNFTELMVKYNHYERFQEDSKDQALNLLIDVTGGSEEVTELQFLKFCLRQMSYVEEGSLDHIHQAFEGLQPTKGVVTFDCVREHMDSPFAPAEVKEVKEE